MSNKELPIGIYEKALPSDISWLERLQMASNAGYDFIEISIDESEEKLSRLDWDKEKRAELREAIAATGVPILSMCLSGHRKYPIGSENEEIRKHAMDIMRKAIQFSVDIGIRIIQLAGYDVYYEKSNEKTKKIFLESLQQSVQWAGAVGVTLAIETMDYEFMDSVKKAMVYVDLIDSPWLQVYPDVGNLSSTNKNIEKELLYGKGHIVGIHLKDSVEGKVRRIPFGEGTVDFVNFFKLLTKLDFQGPLLIEMWTDDNKDAANIVKNAREWILEKWNQASKIDDNIEEAV